LLQRGLYYLTFYIEGPKNLTTFLGLLIEHQYPEVFVVYIFFRFSFGLTLVLLHETSPLFVQIVTVEGGTL
jgi:hypothetical protein